MPLLDPLSSIVEALRKDKIIPDVLPEGFTPSILFSVSWGDKDVILGNDLTKLETENVPRVQITPVDALNGENETGNTRFTLAMLDPDAPSRADPKFGPFRHWIMSGLESPTPGEVIAAASAERDLLAPSLDPLSASSTKPPITPYRAPGPGPGTGEHRYVFLLFQEPLEGYNVREDAPERGTELEARRCWSVFDFAKKHNLTLVGANYFKLNSD